MKKVFLEDLPKRKYGNKVQINWKETVGEIIHFIYDDIEDDLMVIDYIKRKNNNKLKIKYKNNEIEIFVNHFINCHIGDIIPITFRINIGYLLKDEKRNLTIIDREIRKKENIDKKGRKSIANQKWYLYHCNVCGAELWINESNLLKGNGCSCCKGLTVIEGINDIPTVAPWMIKYFQGGYDEAKMYTKSNSKKIYPICPTCGRVKDKKMKINTIYECKTIGCSCESGGMTYPEKFMFSCLEQLNLDFQTQLTKSTFEWCNKYKYDFYFELNNKKYIIETHGMQHYEETTGNWTMSLKEVQENDNIKKELALKNGINKYIIIDCRYSDFEFIKQNISDSKLNEIFDLSKIDWLTCERFTLSNFIKEVCEFWKNKKEYETTTDISNHFNKNSTVIRRYLKIGHKLGWCEYDGKKELCKSVQKTGNKHLGSCNPPKQIEIFKEGKSLGEFPSLSELTRQSNDLFGTILHQGSMSEACKTGKPYKGFTFKYV